MCPLVLRPFSVLELGGVNPPGAQRKSSLESYHSLGVDLMKTEREVTKQKALGFCVKIISWAPVAKSYR